MAKELISAQVRWRRRPQIETTPVGRKLGVTPPHVAPRLFPLLVRASMPCHKMQVSKSSSGAHCRFINVSYSNLYAKAPAQWSLETKRDKSVVLRIMPASRTAA